MTNANQKKGKRKLHIIAEKIGYSKESTEQQDQKRIHFTLSNPYEDALLAISFPEAAILLVSDRDRDLWDNPFPDNRILVVVPTAHAQTSLENGV